MNKRIIVGVACAGFVSAVHAQSSVTLYGLIDAGVSYVSRVGNGAGSSGRALQYGDGVASGSRWGIRGTEDLGRGLSALFVVENGFNSGNGTAGQGGAMFGRQAYVGLSQKGIGSVTFGRQYSFSTDILGAGYSIGANTPAGNYAYHVNDVDLLTSSRINNAIKFASANFGGFTFGGLYGFSNQAGAFAGAPGSESAAGSSRAYSLGAQYAYGPFSIGTAYTDIRYPSQAIPSFSTSLANASTGTIRDLRTFGVGGRYTAGAATVWALWTHTRFAPVSGASTRYDAYEAGGKYALSATVSAGLGYTYSRASGSFGGHWNQLSTAVDYAFTKRTDVYLLGIYQRAAGTLANGEAVQAQIGSSSSNFFQPSGSGSRSQAAVRVGLRHKF